MTLYSLNKVLWKLKHLKLECFSFILPKGSFQQLENFHQEALYFFPFSHKGGVICISEVIDISPSKLVKMMSDQSQAAQL